MKKFFFSCFLILSIIVVSCPVFGQTAALPKHISIATLKQGGVTYVIGVGIGNLVKKYMGIGYTVEPGRGTPVWGYLMKEGKMEFAIQSIYDPYCAVYGIEEFAAKGKHPIRLVGTGNTTFFNVITTEKTGIKTIKDLRGKRWRAQPAAGSWLGPVSEAFLRVNGMTKDDVIWLRWDSANAAMRDLIEGRIDAFTYAATPITMEIEKTAGLYVIPLSKEEGKAAEEAAPGCFYGIWPKGAFGLKWDTPSIGMPMALFARADLSDELVYGVAKAVYDHTDELAKVHAKGAEWNLDVATKHAVIPFHGGAVRYYKEKGIWNKSLDETQLRLLKGLQ